MSVTPIPATAGQGAETSPARRRWPLLAVVVIVLVAAGGYLFLRPDGSTAPEPGEVVTLEPIQVNLAAGHYLKVGLAVQITKDATQIEGSRALDAAITLFSGRTVAELSDPEQRQILKGRLVDRLGEVYDDQVMDVYFTEFVMQ